MSAEFQPEPVASQVARYLRARIADGTWSQWMPAERELAERLRVSRGTVRAALAELQKERLIETRHGIGTRPRGGSVRPAAIKESVQGPVRLLMPEPLNALRPYLIIWIDLLRSLLADAGVALHLHIGPSYFAPRGAAHLERLIAQHPGSCWVLALSNETVQHWFERKGLPCVVLGLPGDDVSLPAVAVDMQALGRHAAGELLRLGHRRLAVVVPHRKSPGVTAAIAGFVSAARVHGDDVAVESIEDDTERVDGVIRRVSRRVQGSKPVSGLLVLNPMVFLSLLTGLPEFGVRVSKEVSLITTHGDPFLSYVRPSAARYTIAHATLARKLLRAVLQARAGATHRGGPVLVEPEYLRGQSVGPAPRAH
jgi:DNA-binding LacI/PurR family transcriptional regulator